MKILFCVGKGDLVGCDMNTHLQTYNGTGTSQSNNPDVVVKSSSDVKVSRGLKITRLNYCNSRLLLTFWVLESNTSFKQIKQFILHKFGIFIAFVTSYSYHNKCISFFSKKNEKKSFKFA